MKKWIVATLLLLTTYAGASSFVPTTKQVFPTRNDVATTVGDGRFFTEATMTMYFKKAFSSNFVANGLTVPASSGNLFLTISGGYAYVNGYMVNVGSNTTLTLAASNTNYVFLELPVTSGLVSNVQFTVNTTGAVPSTNSLLLCSAVAGITSITSTQDLRSTAPLNYSTNGFKAIVNTTGLASCASGTDYAFTWLVPNSVTSVRAFMIGGGGGGGGGNNPGGGGGGGGAYAWLSVTVTPGSLVSGQVGKGGPGGIGTGGGAAQNGTDGGATWLVTNSATTRAPGGLGGVKGGGAGGTPGFNVISDTLWGMDGLTGTAGSALTGGAGGGVHGDYGTAGGTAASAVGNNASGYGAGGSGGGNAGFGSGGCGAPGLMLLFY